MCLSAIRVVHNFVSLKSLVRITSKERKEREREREREMRTERRSQYSSSFTSSSLCYEEEEDVIVLVDPGDIGARFEETK